MLSPTLLVTIPVLVIFASTQVRYWRYKQYAAWPQLPTSLIWGHMKTMYELIKSGASDRHPDIIFASIHKKLGLPAAFVIDLRPLSFAMCIVCSHEVAEQVTKASKKFPYSLTKSPNPYVHLLGPNSIVTNEGEEWKSLRRRFNPGFAPQHLMTFLPCILDKTWYFLEHLDNHARTGDVFKLDELCINLTFDIIGAVTMDVDLDAQHGTARQSEIIRLFRALDGTYRDYSGGSWGFWGNPFTAWQQRNLAARLNVLLRERIVHRFSEQKRELQSPTATFVEDLEKKKKRSRSVLALSLQDIDTLTPAFIDSTCDQLKSFLSAGHDTTSILLQWTFYELSRTPRVLAALVSELDDIFGPDPSPYIVREKLLSNSEETLRKMSYTSAVIKEILRLYPPAASARKAAPGAGYFVNFPDGRELCMDGLIVYNCEAIIQRDAAVYGNSNNDFVPERWLGDTDTSENTNLENKSGGNGGGVPPSAWRPFERGPRSCIGQELANLEVRVILACTVRRYAFTKVGQGEIVRGERGEGILNAKGQFEVKSKLYNRRQVTAKPVDGTRMLVKLNPKAADLVKRARENARHSLSEIDSEMTQ